MTPVPRQSPATLAFFEEMRLNGFIEGQNLAVTRGEFEAGDERLPELAETELKSRTAAVS